MDRWRDGSTPDQTKPKSREVRDCRLSEQIHLMNAKTPCTVKQRLNKLLAEMLTAVRWMNRN
jgi:hypothetical protein